MALCGDDARGAQFPETPLLRGAREHVIQRDQHLSWLQLGPQETQPVEARELSWLPASSAAVGRSG